MSAEAPHMSPEAAFQSHPPILTEITNPFATQVPEVVTQVFHEPEVHEQKPAVTVDDIHNEVTLARERVAQAWQQRGKIPGQYEPKFDEVCYVTLGRFRHMAPEAYQEARQQIDSYTEMQLKTAIGERLKTSLSEWQYDLKEDGLYGQGTNEKAVSMFERGRDFRKKHGKPVDWDREEAEVRGIVAIDQDIEASVQINPHTQEKEIILPEGTMWLSVSLQGKVAEGSIYKHNFYDIHTVKVDKQGKKYVESRRYTSTLTPELAFQQLGKFDRGMYPEDLQPTAEHFLANPFKFRPGESPFQNADDIHQYLHKEHAVLGSKEFKFVIAQIEPVMKAYIAHMNRSPQDMEGQYAKLRAVFNAADEIADRITGKSGGQTFSIEFSAQTTQITQQEMLRWQNQEVRAVDTGCGLSNLKVSVSKEGTVIGDPYSVAEFARQQKSKDNFEDYLNDPNLCRCQGEKPHFHCIGTIKKEVKERGEEKVVEEPCPYKVIVGKGITKCPKCGTGKTC